MKNLRWLYGAFFSGVLIVVGVLALVLVGPSHAGVPPTLTQGTRDTLTVSPGDLLPEEAKCTSDGFLRNSIIGVKPGNPAFQQWSDAVSTPFKSSNKNVMLTEVRAENCGNPVELDMNIKALAAITLADFNVGEANPWMADFESKADKSGLRIAFLTKKSGQGDNAFVTSDMQQYAALTNTLLTRLSNVGVVTERSVANWHLPSGGLVAGELPRVVLNNAQEGLPVLRLELTEKARGCVVAVGFNTQDKRFETMSCAQPVQPKAKSAKPTTHQPPTTPTKQPTPTPTPTPESTPTPRITPTPTPKCPPGFTGTPPKCLQPKTNVFKRPGQDGTRDSGTGVKPVVPRVTTPASPPAHVVTSVTGGGGVIDTPTNKPGSETGVTAPGASAPPATPLPIVPAPPALNTTGNTTDPGLPFQ